MDWNGGAPAPRASADGAPTATASATEPRRRLYDSYFATYYGADHACPSELSASVRAYFDQHLGPHLPADRGAAILDVGCGFGGLLMHLRDRGYSNVSGVDVSPEQVAMAHRLGLTGVTLGEAAEHLADRRDELDLVCAIDVLEHLERSELLELLDAVHAALRPGGRMLLQVPNADGPFACRMRYFDLTHERAFTGKSIAQALRAAGFTTVSIHPVRPAVHGVPSAIRWALWQVIRLGLTGYLAVETGVLRGHVLSQNLVAVAER
jgi:cyclopropane fatty-acyl-phospholipid synthase-like methyltransferase